MVSLRCLLLNQHVPGGLVVRDRHMHLKCERCGRLSPGWDLGDLVPPTPRYAGTVPGRLATGRADGGKWRRRLRIIRGYRVG